MPAERLSMRKVREVLRLKYACGASERVIARSVGIGRTAIGEYIRRAAVIGITWPVPEELDDAALERKLFAPAGYNPPRSKPLPDWGHIHAELRRRGVTLALLWEEYRGHHPDGYGYSRYVAAAVMWRKTWAQAGEGWFPWLDPQHNFELRGGYRAFRNVISDGSARGRGLVCRSVISTRASALAFISISTSA
jgi:hypothetical protein